MHMSAQGKAVCEIMVQIVRTAVAGGESVRASDLSDSLDVSTASQNRAFHTVAEMGYLTREDEDSRKWELTSKAYGLVE